jgi:hypothetical protein
VAISIFSKPLALIIGLLILGIQVLAPLHQPSHPTWLSHKQNKTS